MIKNKKAQGLSLTTIIIAIIALLVLVVVALIFTGSLNEFAQRIKTIFTGQKTCSDLDGVDISPEEECPSDTRPYLGFVKDLEEGHICCVEAGE